MHTRIHFTTQGADTLNQSLNLKGGWCHIWSKWGLLWAPELLPLCFPSSLISLLGWEHEGGEHVTLLMLAGCFSDMEKCTTENTKKLKILPPATDSTGLLVDKHHYFNNPKETTCALDELSPAKQQQFSHRPLGWQGQAALGYFQNTVFKTGLESRNCCWTFLF